MRRRFYELELQYQEPQRFSSFDIALEQGMGRTWFVIRLHQVDSDGWEHPPIVLVSSDTSRMIKP